MIRILLVLMVWTIHRVQADEEYEPPNLSRINGLRQRVANRSGVAMPDLVWDPELVKIARSMPTECEKLKPGPDYRVFADAPPPSIDYLLFVVYDHTARKWNVGQSEKQKDIDDLAAKLTPKLMKTSLFSLELFNSAQSKIGCARISGTCALKSFEEDSKTGTVYKMDKTCVLGPANTWKNWDTFTQTTHSITDFRSRDITKELQLKVKVHKPTKEPPKEEVVEGSTGVNSGVKNYMFLAFFSLILHFL